MKDFECKKCARKSLNSPFHTFLHFFCIEMQISSSNLLSLNSGAPRAQEDGNLGNLPQAYANEDTQIICGYIL